MFLLHTGPDAYARVYLTDLSCKCVCRMRRGTSGAGRPEAGADLAVLETPSARHRHHRSPSVIATQVLPVQSHNAHTHMCTCAACACAHARAHTQHERLCLECWLT